MNNDDICGRQAGTRQKNTLIEYYFRRVGCSFPDRYQRTSFPAYTDIVHLIEYVLSKRMGDGTTEGEENHPVVMGNLAMEIAAATDHGDIVAALCRFIMDVINNVGPYIMNCPDSCDPQLIACLGHMEIEPAGWQSGGEIIWCPYPPKPGLMDSDFCHPPDPPQQ